MARCIKCGCRENLTLLAIRGIHACGDCYEDVVTRFTKALEKVKRHYAGVRLGRQLWENLDGE